MKPLDRWDPITAEVGGVWDTLLGEGLDLWGSSATSDFHEWNNGDYWPCQFSETRIYARDRSGDAVIEALGAGSYFGVHGRVVSDVAFSLATKGLSRDATAGETVRLAAGAGVDVTLTATVPSEDWDHQPNRLDRLELIAIDRQGARVAARATDAPVVSLAATLTVPGGRAGRAGARMPGRPGPAGAVFLHEPDPRGHESVDGDEVW